MILSPRGFPPSTCMCRCMTVWPAASPVFAMTRKPVLSMPVLFATSFHRVRHRGEDLAGTSSTMLS
jgi:hypothetical protein